MGRAEHIIVVGNGMVGVRFLERLAALAPDRHKVTVIGSEPVEGYNRVLLSALLAGDVGQADVRLRDRAWYAAQDFALRTGVTATRIESAASRLELSTGESLAYDRLVLATGSSAIRLPLPGSHLDGVVTFRDVADLDRIREAAAPGAPVAVIGGGLLGIEAAYGLARLGCDVTLVHVMPRLMERQLDARAAQFLRDALARKRIKILLNADTASILGESKVEGLAFKNGTQLKASLVVMAVGVRPQSILAREVLDTGRGIKADDGMTTSVANIHAIGECAEHRGQIYGLVEPGYEQADVLARRIAGEADAAYEGSVLSTNLKISGIGVFSVGAFDGGDGMDSVTFEDRRKCHYRRLVFKGDQLAGAILIGETGDALWYRDMIRDGLDISALRPSLIFGRTHAERSLREAA
ncbi:MULTISPECIES: FAD-dependent oxidoreductase [unclassified Beijerinckia]|uniref:NAD(P)/FAD-dependent oxidoreductase n=1 Tax=unclassified Beijerinckia TaxID=2638183 RepID=UPI00089A59C3|nr:MULTISPECIES: FAD-dependent oxidoreductase [unclassified Beijerinckia]MDH7795382.1 nitrite reductase (NADH) large subunit [Beijerinckia sp. GAS462]SEB99280.1 assimilatory nitrate reductase (NADH) beta subunit [Beijerinckia sp. 28-YEA-48]